MAAADSGILTGTEIRGETEDAEVEEATTTITDVMTGLDVIASTDGQQLPMRGIIMMMLLLLATTGVMILLQLLKMEVIIGFLVLQGQPRLLVLVTGLLGVVLTSYTPRIDMVKMVMVMVKKKTRKWNLFFSSKYCKDVLKILFLSIKE